MKIDWLKYKYIYFLLSGFLVLVSMFSLFMWGLKLGVDFSGGAVVEYAFSDEISTEEIIERVAEAGYEISSVQKVGEANYLFRFGQVEESDLDKIEKEFGVDNFERKQYERVGPSIGPELVKKTIYAIVISSGAILLWVAVQFKNVRFGVSAILAMFHDSLILIGSFSLLGHFYGVEVDFLFVTALLTTLSFSVHDTIVVYDRIREIRKKHGGEIREVANRALSETMRRSINNSVTIILMLLSLILFGGSSIYYFAMALLIGTVLGTYSSPFVAVPLLVISDKLGRK